MKEKMKDTYGNTKNKYRNLMVFYAVLFIGMYVALGVKNDMVLTYLLFGFVNFCCCFLFIVYWKSHDEFDDDPTKDGRIN